MDAVEIVFGDTAQVAEGGGTYGSRSITVVGAAISIALDRVVEKARRLAAHKLECADRDVVFEAGRVTVAGTNRAVTFGAIADAAHRGHDVPDGFEPGLNTAASFDPDEFNYPAGAHLCTVDVDRETGQVRVLSYAAVDDVGRAINPMIVEGQIHGVVVQGLGQALSERIVWDPETGHLLTGPMLDYGAPRADEVPSFDLALVEFPSLRNPLGVKGAGESGTIAATVAAVNAVLDALTPLGVTAIDPPLTPERVWRAIAAAKGRFSSD